MHQRLILTGYVTLFMLLAGSGTALAVTTDADLKAVVHAYQQQNYELAASYLTPDDTRVEARYWHGLILYQLFQYPQALALLQPLMPQYADDERLLLAVANIAIAEQQWATAETAIMRLSAGQQTQAAAWLRGRLAEARGTDQAALRAYHAALVGNQTTWSRQAVRALVDLHTRRGELEQAYQASRLGRDLSHNAFDRYRYQQLQPTATPTPASAFNARLGYRFEYDNNSTQVSDNAPLSPSEDAAVRHVITGDALYQLGLSESVDLFAAAHVTQSLHHESDVNDFDYTRLNAVLGVGGQGRRMGWRVPLEYTHNRYGGDFFSDTVSVIPGIYYQSPQQWLFHLFARLSDHQFAAVTNPNEDRDGESYRLGLLVNGEPSERFRLRLIVEAGEDDTQGSNWQRDALRAYSYLQYDLDPAWTLGLGFQYQRWDYDRVHSIFLQRREDELKEAFLSISWRFHKQWRLRAQASHQQQDSDIAVLDYQRQVFTLGLSWEY